MDDVNQLLTEIERAAKAVGLDRIGVCSADPFPEVRSDLEQRSQTGLAARLGFTFRDPERSTTVTASLPWAARLVVAGRAYLPEAGEPGEPAPGTGRIARFAVEDWYQPLRAGLELIAERLRVEGYRAEVLSDDDRLVDRAAAVRAGIGWWGKNTMVLAPGEGPWMLLGSVATDALLPESDPMRRDCGTCSACLPACPTGALIAPGILDARRCLAAILQTGGWIPTEFREAIGDRLYGCDDCIEACPPGGRLLERSVTSGGRIDLTEVLSLSDVMLLERFGHFYIPKRQPRYLRRNALVALGNTATGAHLRLLVGYLGNPDSMLRGHAAWSLGRLGSTAARQALTAWRGYEHDDQVLDEIDQALASVTPGSG